MNLHRFDATNLRMSDGFLKWKTPDPMVDDSPTERESLATPQNGEGDE